MYVDYFLEISKNCWLFDWYKLRVFLFCTLNLILCLTPSSRNNFLGFLLHISAWSGRNIHQILPPTGALHHQRFLCSCSLWIKFDILTVVDGFMLGKCDARVHPRWCRGIAVEKSGDRCQEPCSSWRGSWLSSWPDHNPWSQYPFHRKQSVWFGFHLSLFSGLLSPVFYDMVVDWFSHDLAMMNVGDLSLPLDGYCVWNCGSI